METRDVGGELGVVNWPGHLHGRERIRRGVSACRGSSGVNAPPPLVRTEMPSQRASPVEYAGTEVEGGGETGRW